MALATAAPEPFRLAGFPLPAWGFAVRTWAAMMLALYAAFWLQLEGAASAALCVGILAVPTRGHALEKAFWRLFGTLVGVIVSIVIAAAFGQIRELMILSFACWLAICVYVGSQLDGNRSYAAVLSGYTVAIVAIVNIDTPQNIFLSGVNRGAALSVGVVAVTLVNDFLAAPHLSQSVAAKLIDARDKVRAFAVKAFRQGAPSASEVGDLLQAVTSIRTDVDAVAVEGISGGRRAAAAASALSALVQEVNIIRAVAATLDSLSHVGPRERDRLASALEDSTGKETAALRDEMRTVVHSPTTSSDGLLAASGVMLLLEHDQEAKGAIADMQSGRGRRRAPQLPVFRSRRVAQRDALRAFCVVALVGAGVSLLNWPAVAGILVSASAMTALSSTSPDQRGFVKGACMLFPIVAILAGITKFVILGGADAFPLLAMATAPVIIGGALLLTIGNPTAFVLGFLTIVLTPNLLNPSNPEDYGALSFLVNALLFMTGIFVLLLAVSVLFPTTDTHRRRWFLRSAEKDCASAVASRSAAGASLSNAFRDASRIAQLNKLKATDDAQREATLEHACRLADLSFAAGRIRDLLPDSSNGIDEPAFRQARRAIARLDPVALRQAGDHLLHSISRDRSRDRDNGLRAGMAMIWMSNIINRSPAEISRLRSPLT